ncbi:uncharacterized protein LOC125675414 [Ostrea edulis]|uniref:uncharacterized protein LOC125675414 n=1 Tax=Ostrea edulis TaxID=37623 RepID=UPI0024AEF2ED|nr:uncharacterized protein LOC125675414 [Ostrea edulis]
MSVSRFTLTKMEEDTTGLKTLISHRRHRPSYTRVISQEFSKERVAVERRGKRKAQRHSGKSTDLSDSFHPSTSETTNFNQEGCVLDDENDSTDDSKYFSAEENPVPNENTKLNCNFLPSSSSYSSNEGDLETAMKVIHKYENKDTLHIVVDKSTHGIHKRAPRKKQKRKWRQLNASNSVCLFRELPFFDMGVLEDPGSVDVNKGIPSLYTLCVKALTKNIRKLHKCSIIPCSIKRDIDKETLFYNEKVSWLNTYLAKFEEMQSKYSNLNVPTRTVWNYKPRPPEVYRRRGRGDIFPKGDIEISCLPVINLCAFKECHRRIYVINHVMCVLSSLLHLTLPYPDPYTGKLTYNRKNRKLSTSYDRAVENVTVPLRQSYPETMKMLYDKVLPYVFWARGDVKRAKEGFLYLISTNIKPRYKAMYVYEMGRMLRFFEDPTQVNLASISEISEIFVSKAYHCQAEVAQQISKQSFLLKANLYDQGVLTIEKAIQAADLWTYSVHALPAWGTDSWEHFYFMDSLLCYHASTRFEMGVDWLNYTKERLEPLCGVYPDLYIFLSMLYALQKNERRSQSTFLDFQKHETRVTLTLITGSISHPWTALMEAVKQSPSFRPLKVLWRTQLNPPKFNVKIFDTNSRSMAVDFPEDCEPTEADISGHDLNLHLTPEGHLTGDLQISLPPLQSVLLDPYTGSICLPAAETVKILRNFHSVPTYVSYFLYGKCCFPQPLPTPMEVYRGQNGTVQLIFSGYSKDMPAEIIIKLFWEGTNGETAGINLASQLRDHTYQRAMDLVKSLSTDDEVKACMLEVFRLCYSDGYKIPLVNPMDKSYLFEYVRAAYKNYHTQRKESKQNKTAPPSPPSAMRIMQEKFKESASLRLFERPLVFGEDILFRFNVDHSHYYEHLVVIHTQNRKDFKHPTILMKCMNGITPHFPDGISRSAERFYLSHADRGNRYRNIMVFDRNLHQVDVIDTAILQPIESDIHIPIVIRRSVFAINASHCLYCVSNQNGCTAEHLDPIHRLTFLGDMLVMVTVTGYLLFFESLSLLPISVIVHPRAFSLILDNLFIFEICNYLKILGEKSFRDDSNQEYVRAAIALDSKLIIIKTQPNTYGLNIEDIAPVRVTSSVTLSGQAKDVCFLSESAGYLVSASIFNNKHRLYREILFHYNHGGQLLGVVLSLGPGPRSMFPVYLPGKSDLSTSNSQLGRKGWHVYMRDGHDGIICVYLGDVAYCELSYTA